MISRSPSDRVRHLPLARLTGSMTSLGCAFLHSTILLLISWKWTSHTLSTVSSLLKVTKPKPRCLLVCLSCISIASSICHRATLHEGLGLYNYFYLSELGEVAPDLVQGGGGREAAHEYLLGPGHHLQRKQITTIGLSPAAEHRWVHRLNNQTFKTSGIKTPTFGVDSFGNATLGSIFFPSKL